MDCKPTYICDPEKNVDCPKSICQALGRGECIYTTNHEFAVNPDQPEYLEKAFNKAFEETVNESFEKFRDFNSVDGETHYFVTTKTNQDKLAEMVRTMDVHKLAIFITNGIECPNCPAEKYCDQHMYTTEDGWSRVHDENGELLDCNQIFEKWLKEEVK